MNRNYLLLFLLTISTIIACNKSENAKSQKTYIGLQKIGDVPEAYMDTVYNAMQAVYSFPLVRMPDRVLPTTAYTAIKVPRYRADTIIRLLKREQPDSIAHTLAIMLEDISTTKKGTDQQPLKPAWKYDDWGILGLGYRPGPSCVVSTFRMKTTNKAQFFDRLKKVSMHELGHNLGLKHCKHDPKCVMRDAAETIKTVDQVELKLCNTCTKAIEGP